MDGRWQRRATLRGLGDQRENLEFETHRVSGKKRDNLQEVIAKLRELDFDLPFQYVNFRD